MSENCTKSLSMRFVITAAVDCHINNTYQTINFHVCQLKAHKKVDDHPNVIRFLGLCKGQYICILLCSLTTVDINDDLFC